MPRESSAGRISIRPLDDLFEPTVDREQPAHRETLPTSLSPDRLKPFPNHPFKVVQDEAMQQLVESVCENGVIEPILCRPDGDGGYQIVSGHRRQTAAILAGLTEIPVTVREMDDHTATIVMVDSNLHRPTILPSEKAFAFKMKLAALEEQAFLRKAKALIRTERAWLKKALEAMGFWVCDSEANYLLFHGPEGLHTALLEQKIAIRNCDNYHGLGPGWYRIAVRTHKENEALMDAMASVTGRG